MFIRLSIILVNNVILDKQQIITEEKARVIIKFQDYNIQDYSTYKLKIQYKDLYEKYK